MHHHQGIEGDVPSDCTNVANSIGSREIGPDYKDQCRPSSYRLSSSTTEATTPSSEVAARHSDGPNNLSSDRSYHIPIVCGVPLPDESHSTADQLLQAPMSVPSTIRFEAGHHRHRSETASSEMDPCPERAPPISDSSTSRKSSRSSHSSFSQQERKYWMKVIACAVIVNTLLVLAGVVGGVCGTMGCRFSSDFSSGNSTDMSDGSGKTDAPSPSPSQRRTASFAPTAGFTPPIPTRLNETLAPSVYSGEVAGPADPAFGPLLDDSLAPSPSSPPISFAPTTNMTGPDDFSSFPEHNTNGTGFPILLLIPVAVVVDVLLVIGCLFFHYKRWIKARNTSGDGSMTSLDEMHSLRSMNG